MSQPAHSPVEGRSSPSAPCVELHGAFDARAARDVLETLQRHANTGHVLLDFSKVNTFQDLALALLVQGLRRMPELQLQTRGIPGHPARVLQYLDIDPHTLAPPRVSRRCPACFPERDHGDLDD